MIEELPKIVLSLVFVLGVILLAARVMKGRGVEQSGVLKVLGYLSLGPRRGIAVIKAGGEVLLVGVTQNDLKLLKAFPEDAFEGELKTIKDNIQQIKGLKRMLANR